MLDKSLLSNIFSLFYSCNFIAAQDFLRVPSTLDEV